MVSQEVLDELSKLYKPKCKFTCIEEVKNLTNLSDMELDYIVKTITYRINPIEWIKTRIKVFHPLRGIINFDLYDYQENAIKLFLAKHFILTLKSRQVGMSTVTQSLCLWSAMNYQKYNVLIISAGQRNAQKFLEKIKNMYTLLPDDEFKLKLVIDNKSTLQFSNGSTITALPATSQAARGESVNLFIIDEAAFIENIESVYQACYPTISRAFPKNTETASKPFGIIIISTPNGVSGTGGWYFEMYSGALIKNNKYMPIKIHWSLIPEFDDAWYVDQCMQLNWDYRQIASELELSFVSSGNTYIPSSILDTINTIEPNNKSYDDNLWVWELPIKDEKYILGVDVAYGDKKDSSVIEIIKASTLEQVAEYESNSIIVDKFADIIISISKLYNNAITNIERNAVGKVLIDKIIDKVGYGGMNLYRDISKNNVTPKIGEKSNYKTDIGTLVGTNRDILLANMYGIVLENYGEALSDIVSISNTNDASKAKEKFEALMKKNNNTIRKNGIIKSDRLLNQLLGFIVDEHNKPSGNHDDCVMAWVHSLYCYTKNKHKLLVSNVEAKNIAMRYNGIENTKNVDLVKFMQAGGSKIWNSMPAEQLAILLNENEKEKEENNEINNDNGKINKSNLAEIYKHMYGL